mgnify:CR=1 FL=1
MHANELPLSHIIENLDDGTTGPIGFNGPIGKQLADVEVRRIVNFSSIDAALIQIDKDGLSTNQKYLLDVFEAITRGFRSREIGRKNPGKMEHSR